MLFAGQCHRSWPPPLNAVQMFSVLLKGAYSGTILLQCHILKHANVITYHVTKPFKLP